VLVIRDRDFFLRRELSADEARGATG